MVSRAELPHPRIVSRIEIQTQRSVRRLMKNARQVLVEAHSEANQMRERMEKETRRQALEDSARAIAELVADAEREVRRRLDELEPEIARLVSDTVVRIIGAVDLDEAVTRATGQALARLRDHRKLRIHAAPDVAEAVQSAVLALSPEMDELPEVIVDDRLEPGRSFVVSDKGHVEIGLEAQIDAATEIWRETGDAKA